MRVAIVDDEENMIEQIQSYMKRFETERGMKIETFTFVEAMQFVENYDKSFDVVLLDVEMPGMNGIEVAKRIRQQDKNVLLMFITNMAQYALHGYEVEALDYVIKPLGYQEFAMKMKKVLRYIGRNVKRQILLQTTDGMQPLSIADITYVEVIRHYLYYHTAERTYEVRGTMRDVETELEQYHFVRCNNSYLVNLAHITAINGNSVTVKGEELPVSRNKKNEFINTFARYVGGME